MNDTILDGVGDLALHDPLELDEENFRLSMKSDMIAQKKIRQLSLVDKAEI